MTDYTTRFTAWPLLVSGIILIVVGLICLLWPGLAFATAGLIIGIGFVLSAAACFSALALGNSEVERSALIANGALDLIIGILFCIYPIASAYFLLWLIFAVLIFFGVVNLVIGYRERSAGFNAGVSRMVVAACAIIMAILMMLFPDLLMFFIGIAAVARGIMLVAGAVQAPREIEM